MNQQSHVPVEEQASPQAPRPYRWYHKFSAILLIIFCLEIGTFLLVFPWYGNTWENNFFSSLLRQGYWQNSYFRGAVSGLGIVNLYICFVEILRLRRFW
jgi:hypothetical protein